MKKNEQLNFPIIVEIDEDKKFIVSCPVFRGCHSYGDTIEEAMKNLSEVIEICIDELGYEADNYNKYIGIREISININQKCYA